MTKPRIASNGLYTFYTEGGHKFDVLVESIVDTGSEYEIRGAEVSANSIRYAVDSLEGQIENADTVVIRSDRIVARRLHGTKREFESRAPKRDDGT